MNESRGAFASKIGVVLATAGSAVGLGNIWRFPYLTGQNGGAAFILIYIGCILAVGLPAMLCEFVIGRNAHANASRAYGRGLWKLVGYLSVFTGFIIMGFYSVVAGWTLQYTFASLVGHLSGDAAYFHQYFADFTNNPYKPVCWTILFLLGTHWIITNGVQKGIERASKIMMPLLFILLLVLVVCSLSLPGAWKGVDFMLHFDASKVSASTVFEALGQTFFSLSVGMAALCTYASYFDKNVNLTRSAYQIVTIDTLVAILSGLMIFPAAFAVGVNADSGPSLLFITLPNVFQQAFASVPWLGYLISLLFYVLLVLAALTSIISMHETPTVFVSEEFHINRRKAASIVSLLAMIVGALCSLSLGPCQWLQVMGKSLFDFFDFLSANVLLTVGGFFTCLYVGWVLPRKVFNDQMTNWGTLHIRLLHLILFAIRFVAPLGILLIFLHQFGVI